MCFTARAAKYRSLLAFLHTSRSAAKLLRFVSTVPLKPNTAAATYVQGRPHHVALYTIKQAGLYKLLASLAESIAQSCDATDLSES